MFEAEAKTTKLEREAQEKDEKMLQFSKQINDLTNEKEELMKESEKRLNGIKEYMKLNLQEQFAVYKITDGEILKEMLDDDP